MAKPFSPYDCILKIIVFLRKCLAPATICPALQRTNTEKLETNIPRKGYMRPQSQFPHSCVCERFIYLYIPTIDLPILLQEVCGPILGIYRSLTDT
jgi:hypothetical protein